MNAEVRMRDALDRDKNAKTSGTLRSLKYILSTSTEYNMDLLVFMGLIEECELSYLLRSSQNWPNHQV